ncbi:MAG: glycosyltransferase family 4 protein [Solirubrobacteraceae bacterium]
MSVEIRPDIGRGRGGAGSRSLRVDLLTPCFWPEVRRGSERFTRELADGLLERGHRPRLITSHPGKPSRRVEDGLPVVRVPRPPDRRLRRRMWEDYVTHLPLSRLVLGTGDADLAHATYGPDAAMAARWGTRTGRPVVFSFMGIPDHDAMFERRKRLDYFVEALAGCDVVVALSQAAVDGFERWFGHQARLIPPGVNLEAFPLASERAERPTIICAADLGEPRKNVGLLVEAFARVRRDRPDVRLVLSRPRSAVAAEAFVGDAPGVELTDLDDRAALARAYGEAWVSVLASTGEAFGLVLVEALSCGTPVVATRAGGMAEIVDRPEIGRLFGPGDEAGLARALAEALELAEDPATRAACRTRAEDFSTDRTTEQYVELYQELL